jgi:hypothetical protein
VKRLFVVLAVACAAGLSGAAVASVLATSPTPTPSSEPAAASDHPGQGHEHEREAKREDHAAHGGTLARFASASACALVDVSTLPAGWTHGDYVSAVAADGTQALVPQAAHSDCGKPMSSVRHCGGPPPWANAARQADNGDTAGS